MADKTDKIKDNIDKAADKAKDLTDKAADKAAVRPPARRDRRSRTPVRRSRMQGTKHFRRLRRRVRVIALERIISAHSSSTHAASGECHGFFGSTGFSGTRGGT